VPPCPSAADPGRRRRAARPFHKLPDRCPSELRGGRGSGGESGGRRGAERGVRARLRVGGEGGGLPCAPGAGSARAGAGPAAGAGPGGSPPPSPSPPRAIPLLPRGSPSAPSQHLLSPEGFGLRAHPPSGRRCGTARRGGAARRRGGGGRRRRAWRRTIWASTWIPDGDALEALCESLEGSTRAGGSRKRSCGCALWPWSWSSPRRLRRSWHMAHGGKMGEALTAAAWGAPAARRVSGGRGRVRPRDPRDPPQGAGAAGGGCCPGGYPAGREQSIEQSIERSTERSIERSTERSIERSIERRIERSIQDLS